MKVCLDLFAGSGGFSAAFADSPHWRDVTVDNRPETDPDVLADVMDLRPADLPDADVVLAGHPCTLFSTAGNHEEWDHEARQPVGERAREHVAMVFHTIGLIRALAPDYWFLENPRGRLRWILGEPEGTVTYCQYGTDYQKPTDLWGDHPAGFTYRSCPRGADCHASNTDDDGYSAIQSMPSGYDERARMPRALSESILEAVERRHEQQTLVATTDGGRDDETPENPPRWGPCPACGETAIHRPHPSGKLMCENCKVCHDSRQAGLAEYDRADGRGSV